jgi:hypothetical protein
VEAAVGMGNRNCERIKVGLVTELLCHQRPIEKSLSGSLQGHSGQESEVSTSGHSKNWSF